MRTPWPWLVALLASGLAVGLMVGLQPDAGPSLAEPAPVEISVEGEGPRVAVVPEGRSQRSTPGVTPPARAAQPFQPVDPSRSFPADSDGLGDAAALRRDRLVACMDGHASRAGGDAGYDGRFTIKLTVSPGGDGALVAVEVVNGPDDADLASCVAGAFADARFETPTHPQSLLWPVPR